MTVLSKEYTSSDGSVDCQSGTERIYHTPAPEKLLGIHEKCLKVVRHCDHILNHHPCVLTINIQDVINERSSGSSAGHVRYCTDYQRKKGSSHLSNIVGLS